MRILVAFVIASVCALAQLPKPGGGSGGGGGGGDTTIVANSGAGEIVLKAGTNVTAKTLVAGSNITLTPAADTITIAATGGGGLASTDIDTSAELATILTDETGTAGGFLRATTSSTVGQVLRVGSGPTIGFGAVDLADSDAITGVLPAANVDTAIARLASPVFTGVVTLPSAASPTIDATAKFALDTDHWGASRGALLTHDGTASVALVGILASDTCANGEVAKFNTGGTWTCETDATGGTSAWDTLTAPTGAVSLVSNGTSETVTIDFQAAFTTGSQFVVKSSTGNPSGGVLAEILGHDADVVLLKATNGGSNGIQLSAAGALAAIGTGQINATHLGGTAAASYALLNSPSLTTPTLGVATATSVNKVAITAPATSATLTIADGKTLTVSNTLTFTGTDSSSVAFGAGGTVVYTSTGVTAASTFATDNSCLRADGTSRGAQASSTNCVIDDSGNMTVASITTSGSTPFLELPQGTASAASANSVRIIPPTGITTAYRWIMPTGVGATGVLKGSVSSNDATLSLAAIADADVPNNITIDLATLASTVTVVDTTDSTAFCALFDSATGSLAIKTDAGCTYDASTGALSATSLLEGANAVPNATDHLGFFAATTSTQLAGVLSDETGSAGGFVRATTSSTVGQVLRVGSGPTIGFGAVDLADTDAVTGTLPVGNWSPLTTNGDLAYHNGTTTTRLARGANGECLTSNATTILWGSCSGGAVAWSSLSAPTGAVSLVSDVTSETVTIDFQAAFTTGSQFVVKSSTGNPSGGVLAEILGHDADVVLLKVTNGGSNGVQVSAAGALTAIGTGAITATDGDSATSFFSSGTIEAGRLPTASDTASGISELATAAETTTGTDTGRTITPDGLSASDFGLEPFGGECIPDATALTVADGKCYFGPLPAKYNNWTVESVVVGVGAAVSSSGAVTVDIDRCGVVATGVRCSGTNVSIFSTLPTIDANEDSTSTAATAAVINGSNDDLTTDQWFRINVDGAGTGTQGLYVILMLRHP